MGRFGIADAVLNPLYTELFSTMTMLEVAEESEPRHRLHADPRPTMCW